MNKAHIKLLNDKYVEAVNGYVIAYVNKHHIVNPIGWVNGRVGEVLIVDGGRRIDFRDIKADIDNDENTQGKEHLATQTDKMNFIEKEKVCGTCVYGGVVDQGDMCPCRKDGKFHKFYDEACDQHKEVKR